MKKRLQTDRTSSSLYREITALGSVEVGTHVGVHENRRSIGGATGWKPMSE